MKVARKLIVLCLVLTLCSCAAALRNFTPEQRLEFEQFVKNCDTPEKLSVWLRNNFEYDRRKLDRVRVEGKTSAARTKREFNYQQTYYPIEVYYKKTGVCNDAANFATYILSQHGYKTKILYTYNPGPVPVIM